MPGSVTYVATYSHIPTLYKPMQLAIALISSILSHALATHYTQELRWSFAG